MKYSTIIYLPDWNDETIKVFTMIKEQGAKQAFDYLMQFYTGEEVINKCLDYPWGFNDSLYREGNFIMTYSEIEQYITLYEIHK